MVLEKMKNEYGNDFIHIGLEKMLWLQRAWSSYLRAAVISGVKSVDVYKTPARTICFVTTGPLRRDGPQPNL